MDTPPAWDDLVRQHNHKVIVVFLAMGIRIERAKELAQMVWIRLLEQQRAGKLERLEFPGIAFAQARFFALDELRKEKTEVDRLQPLDSEAQTIADQEPNVETRLMKREEATLALSAIAQCSPSAQQIFRLLYEDPSMPHALAAQKVGLSVQRVRQIICEVRKKVRAALAREETIDE